MTDEQINIAIAETCSWTAMEPCTCHDSRYRGFPPEGSAYKKHIPDYCNDLNAMHEAEKILDDETTENVTGSYYSYVDLLWLNGGFSATARQRAEAFLKAIGKWKWGQP